MKKLKLVFFMLLCASAIAGPADASCPYTFDTSGIANGVTADAVPIRNDFNYIIQCPDFTGNVGIGNANPSAALHVGGGVGGNFPNGGGTSYRPQILNNQLSGVAGIGVMVNDGVNNRRASLFVNQTDSVWGLGQTYTTGSIPFVITDSTAERLRIDAHGRVGIATTSPTLTLEVNGSAGGTSSWQSPSDARLKKDIVPISNALLIIERLQGVRFEWRSPQERSVGENLDLPLSAPQVGFIAQKVQEVLPEAVTVSNGRDALMRLQESKIVPVLVEAVKEQAKQIAQLQKRVELLSQRQALQTNVPEEPKQVSKKRFATRGNQ